MASQPAASGRPADEALGRFLRVREQFLTELRRIGVEVDALLAKLEAAGGLEVTDLAHLQGLRDLRQAAFSGYQGAEEQLISALLAAARQPSAGGEAAGQG